MVSIAIKAQQYNMLALTWFGCCHVSDGRCGCGYPARSTCRAFARRRRAVFCAKGLPKGLQKPYLASFAKFRFS
jgi:hypothetical protein